MTYVKALVAGLSAALAVLIGTLQSGAHLTLLTWLVTAAAALSAGPAVYYTPYKAKAPDA